MTEIITPEFIPGENRFTKIKNAVGMTDIVAPGFNLGTAKIVYHISKHLRHDSLSI